MRTNADGRRLTTIELLPPEADDALAWALDMYEQNRMTQTAIVVGLNQRLEALDIKKISNSSFNRFVKHIGTGVLSRRFRDRSPQTAQLPDELISAIIKLIDERLEAAAREQKPAQ